jgi:hypothetical protein
LPVVLYEGHDRLRFKSIYLSLGTFPRLSTGPPGQQAGVGCVLGG